MKWPLLILFILAVNTNTNTGKPKKVEYLRISKPSIAIVEPLDSLLKSLDNLTHELEDNF